WPPRRSTRCASTAHFLRTPKPVMIGRASAEAWEREGSMRMSRWLMSAKIGSLALVAAPALAAVDAYLQIDGVKGESQTRPGWIEVSSFHWGVGRGISSPTGGSSDRESSAPSVSEIVVTKPTDIATVKMLD